MFAFDYAPNHGGVARLCAEIVAGYGRRGVDLRVLTQRWPVVDGSDVPEATELRVTAARPRREWAALRGLRGMHRRGEVLVCGLWYPEALIATLLRVGPRVVLVHGSELMPVSSRWRRRVWPILQRWVLTRADLVVANSDYARRLTLAAAPRSTAVAIPLAVDPVRFSPGDREAARRRYGVEGEDRRVLCSVSRIHAYKGHETVLRALAKLPEADLRRVVYLVAGRGPYLETLREMAAELGVGAAVRWLGFVPESDLPDLYRAADLFVLCTREHADRQEVEGFGLVYLEAQACGTPAVGTRTGGIPDAISEGDGGWLIEQDAVDDLAVLVGRLVSDPEEFRRAGQAGRRRVESDFTWERYLDRLTASLESHGLHVG